MSEASRPSNPQQTVAELLARARSAAGHRALYRLGAGASYPIAPSPLDREGECDCSGFVCWALRTPREQPDGQWLNTDAMWWDARGGGQRRFVRLGTPRPGAIIVFPALAMARRHVRPAPSHGPKVGHVGIITALEPELRVIHCSATNERRGDAIAETDWSAFRGVPYRLFAWFTGIEGGPHAEA